MAAETPHIDDLAATISDQLRVLTSEVQPGCLSRALHFPQGEHGFPEVTNIVKSSPDLHGALEALPSLPGSGMPAIYLKKCEPFDLGVELVDPRVKVVLFQASMLRLKLSTFSSDIAYSFSPTASRA